MGETLDNAIFGINVIASQTISDNEVEVGDSYTIEVHIDMPGITVEDRSDLVVEVFAVRPDQGTLHLLFIFVISTFNLFLNAEIGGFHMCQVKAEHVGNNLMSVQENPVYEEEYFDGAPSLVRLRKSFCPLFLTGR